jgi:hypothetical protein
MQTPILQSISLVLAGRALAAGIDLQQYWPAASVFQFCHSVRFFEGKPDDPDSALREYAADPRVWLARCLQQTPVQFRLVYLPSQQASLGDRHSVGFVGGGGSWLVEIDDGHDVSWWEPHWRIGDRQDPERRIWEVGYFRRPPQRDMARPVAASPGEIAQRLEHQFAAIADFARGQDLGEFAAVFDAARQRLTSAAPFDNLVHADVDPGHQLSLPARQLLAAAQIGWVFGGMGSWNDRSFPGAVGERYEKLSDDLFGSLIEAVIAAVNDAVSG